MLIILLFLCLLTSFITLYYSEYFYRVTEIISNRTIKPALYFDLVYAITHYKERQCFLRNIKAMHEFTHRIIQDRRQTLQENLKKASEMETTIEHPPSTGTVRQSPQNTTKIFENTAKLWRQWIIA